MLWGLVYEEVTDLEMMEDVEIICYADDTLVLASGRDIRIVKTKMEMTVSVIEGKLKGLGLRMAAKKPEFIVFSPKERKGWNEEVRLTVGGEMIARGVDIRYLGIRIDGRWTLRTHFETVSDKANRIMSALNAIMQNLKGPGERKRRLYANTVQ